MARSSSSPAASSDAPPAREATGRSTAGLLFVSLRPEQWTKNLFVFAGLLFGGRLLEWDAVLLAVLAFVIFCALSGAVYLTNDIADRDADRRHLLKSARPIASGRLPVRTAISAAVALGSAGMAAAFLIRPAFAAMAGLYLVLLLAYSGRLKHIVIIDVLTISAGFVLRALAGAVAVSVPIDQGLLICTPLLALFLALSKRRHELVVLGEGAIDHRRILEEYSPYLLDQMIGVVTASTLVAYSVYVTSPDTAERLGTARLAVTIPFVLYGIFRYLYLVHQKRGGGSPSEILLTDRPLLTCVALWAVSVMVLMYTPLGR